MDYTGDSKIGRSFASSGITTSDFWKSTMKDTGIGTSTFLVGFAMGTAVDSMFYYLYGLVDPTMKNLYILSLVILIQLIMGIFIISIAFQYYSHESLPAVYFRLGYFTSQLFMIGYAWRTFGNKIYDRNTTIDNEKQN
ncbi:MAG: hypothetical protein JKX76_01475 [Colwellia sp.]|nr:hypothetical protein [Colwellia sp.]